MRGSLFVERRLFEPALHRVVDCLLANLDLVGVPPPKCQSFDEGGMPGFLMTRCWEAFAYYLEQVHTRVMGGPSFDYLLREYLMGNHVVPHRYSEVLNFIATTFDHAARELSPNLAKVVDTLEEYCEEIYEVTLEPIASRNLALVVVDSQPYG
jgi:hypothetical protein